MQNNLNYWLNSILCGVLEHWKDWRFSYPWT